MRSCPALCSYVLYVIPLLRGLISHSERGAVLRARLAPIIKPRGGDVRVAEPLLDLGDIGLMGERVSGRRGAQRMDAQPIHFRADAGFQAIFLHDVTVERRRI